LISVINYLVFGGCRFKNATEQSPAHLVAIRCLYLQPVDNDRSQSGEQQETSGINANLHASRRSLQPLDGAA
jgi:hypothetical protein